MKNKILSVGFLAIILLLSCNKQKEEAAQVVDKDQIKVEIQAIENHFAETYNTRNVDNLTYYADDAASYFNNELPIVGKDAIHKFIKEGVENFPLGAKISFESKEVHISNDGIQVLEIGAFTVVDSTNTKVRSGKYFSLFEKRDGKYVCIRDMGNSDPLEE